MGCMLANYIVGKIAKYDQKSVIAHFQILMEMGTEYVFNISDISHFMKFVALVLILGIFSLA